MTPPVMTGEHYEVRTLESVTDDGAPVYAVRIENTRTHRSAVGRASRNFAVAERTAWTALALDEAKPGHLRPV